MEFDYSYTEFQGGEPDTGGFFSNLFSGAGGFLADIGKSALVDVSTASKERLQTEINSALAGGGSDKVRSSDIGNLAQATDHTDRAGLMPSSIIPTSFIPQMPDSIGGFSIAKYTPFLLMGLAGIAGLIVLKKLL